MDGGKGLVEATGKRDGDTWAVAFKRLLAAGGEGDVPMSSGNAYNFGIAIHDGHSAGRFQHVSMGYRLGIDSDSDSDGGATPLRSNARSAAAAVPVGADSSAILCFPLT